MIFGRSPLYCIAAVAIAGCSHSREETVKRSIAIDSAPAGAHISMSNSRREVSLGQAPTKAEVDMVTEYVDFDPWSIVLAGTWCGVSAGFVYLGTQDSSGSAGKPLSMTAGILSGIVCFFTSLDVFMTLAKDGDYVETRYKLGAPIFEAELRGYKTATIALARDELPPDSPLTFHLKPAALAEAGLIESTDRSVVAVFEMIGGTTATAAPMLDQLTEYLASRLAETGRYRIVPRDQLRIALHEQKKESYADCVDTSCQIELGKAVAAQLSLRTQLIHIGNECALSATMYDLKLEATSSGALVRTSCGADKLMDGVDVLVRKLTQ